MPPQPSRINSAAIGGIVITGSVASVAWARITNSMNDSAAPPPTATTTRVASSIEAYFQTGPYKPAMRLTISCVATGDVEDRLTSEISRRVTFEAGEEGDDPRDGDDAHPAGRDQWHRRMRTDRQPAESWLRAPALVLSCLVPRPPSDASPQPARGMPERDEAMERWSWNRCDAALPRRSLPMIEDCSTEILCPLCRLARFAAIEDPVLTDRTSSAMSGSLSIDGEGSATARHLARRRALMCEFDAVMMRMVDIAQRDAALSFGAETLRGCSWCSQSCCTALVACSKTSGSVTGAPTPSTSPPVPRGPIGADAGTRSPPGRCIRAGFGRI